MADDIFGNEESGFVADLGAHSSEVPDYADLVHKPSINGVTLEGDQSSSELGLMDAPSGTPSAYQFLRYINGAWQGSGQVKIATITLNYAMTSVKSVVFEEGFDRSSSSEISLYNAFFLGGCYAEVKREQSEGSSSTMSMGNAILDSYTANRATFSGVTLNGSVMRGFRISISGLGEVDKVVVYDFNPNIPTKLSDLTNDEGFIDNTVNDLVNYYLKSETYTQAEVNALIGAVSTLDIQVVQTLPTEHISTTTIYLVPKTTAGTDNVYDEYVYVNGDWELIGSTSVDLSDYYTKSEVNTLLSGKADTSAIPTKTSDLNNNSGFITSSVNDLQNYYNKTTIDSMLIMDISNTIFGGE